MNSAAICLGALVSLNHPALGVAVGEIATDRSSLLLSVKPCGEWSGEVPFMLRVVVDAPGGEVLAIIGFYPGLKTGDQERRYSIPSYIGLQKIALSLVQPVRGEAILSQDTLCVSVNAP